MMRQIWSCTLCEANRVYGLGQPEHRHARIGCNGSCKGATVHVFVRLTTTEFHDLYGPRQLMNAEWRP
jgi:hypothetical protein